MEALGATSERYTYIDQNQIKIHQSNLHINGKLHDRDLDAMLHTLSSTKHHSPTTDTLQSASYVQSDAQQTMNTNQPNLEHQQPKMVKLNQSQRKL